MTGNVADETARRARAAMAGHGADAGAARALLTDPAGRARATALGALARCGALQAADVTAALSDPHAEVRARGCELGVAFPDAVDLAPLLGDAAAADVAAARWALGERGPAAAKTPAVAALVAVAVAVEPDHGDPLCREAAVAALGAIGDEAGLPGILAATEDKPAVRRRAV